MNIHIKFTDAKNESCSCYFPAQKGETLEQALARFNVNTLGFGVTRNATRVELVDDYMTVVKGMDV